MRTLRYTLLSDGSSDRALMPLLSWTLDQHIIDIAIQGYWADLRRLPRPPRTLSARIMAALELYPCDLLFVHRDAERMPHATRIREIKRELARIPAQLGNLPVICVVPVRMLEAWLLFDEQALRVAAGNPRGRASLHLPRLRDVEQLPDPKALLHTLLHDAKGSYPKRRSFDVGRYVHRVAESIDDFAPLRQLTAYKTLENDVVNALASVPL